MRSNNKNLSSPIWPNGRNLYFATTANYYDCYHWRFLSYHNQESHMRVQKKATNAVFRYPFLYHSISSLNTKVVIKFMLYIITYRVFL